MMRRASRYCRLCSARMPGERAQTDMTSERYLVSAGQFQRTSDGRPARSIGRDKWVCDALELRKVSYREIVNVFL